MILHGNDQQKSYVFALLSVLLWSTIPTAFKISLGHLDILTMLTIASVTSSIVLLITVIATGKAGLIFSVTSKDLIYSALLGFINPFAYYLILLKAYTLLPAQIAQPLNMIWPIILVFLSIPILKQRIPAKNFIPLLISFAGIYVIASQGNLFKPVKSDITGVILATGSSFFWALYFILNMRDKRDESVKLFMNFLFGSVYLLITMFVLDKDKITVPGFLSSVYIGLFEMGITFLFWLKALNLSKSTDKVSNLVYLAPFISLIFVNFILKEKIFITTPAGLLLIITGIIVQAKQTNG